MLVLLLVGYQLYLIFSKTHYKSLHVEQVETIKQQLANKNAFSFAVVGNINNSSSIFHRQFIPALNQSDHDFVISAGNAVSSGAEENYRSLLSMMNDLNKPWLLTYGDNEDSDFGDFRFYKYLGPHFFSFQAGNSQFIFLDGTDNSPYRWQLDWLSRELANSRAENRFVFIGLPLHPPLEETPVFEQDNYFTNAGVARQLRETFEKGDVDTVFSANLSLFNRSVINGVRYITTGGAGGVIVDDDNSFHHYISVEVNGQENTITPVMPVIGNTPLERTFDSVWSAIYSFFYVSFSRFLFVISLLFLLGWKLREIVFQERDFYTHFAIDDSTYRNKSKRIAFFTNNFFPFISGVTISIHRLAKGLKQRGHQLHTFAPTYDQEHSTTDDCTRLRTLMAFGNNQEFRLSNPFQTGIKQEFTKFKPDLVHVHHPFWLGSLGVWRAKRARIPVIYTYHTRLEMYAHYVPLPGALFRNVISHLIVRRFCNRCDGVIVPTYSTEEYLRLIGVKTRLFVQPSGVEFSRFNQPHSLTRPQLRHDLGLAEDDKVLISVSRLGKEKNIQFLIDAMAELRRQTTENVKLVLVGQGDDRAFLEEVAQHLGISDDVLFVGAVEPDNIPAYYQMADIFVFASKSETQGMVILEAMSAGLPVVAIRSSGIDDVIIDGQTGYKPLDDIGLWTEKLAMLVENETKRQQFSEAAVAFARQHDVTAFAENIDRFYSEVLATYHADKSQQQDAV